ncbi:hypothetical protein [Serratia sp. 2723]
MKALKALKKRGYPITSILLLVLWFLVMGAIVFALALMVPV